MKAYITLLSNYRYFLGVVGLYRSLHSVKSKYPLYCMLSEGIDLGIKSQLECIGIRCILLSTKILSEGENIRVNQDSYTHWLYTFDKLRIWGLTQFDKLVFLDSDMMIRENIDSLFDMPSFSASVAGGKMHGWTKLNSGLIVVKPDREVEKQMIEIVPMVLEESIRRNVPVGDQDVIQRYCHDWEKKADLHLDESYNIVADWIITYICKYGFSWNNGEKKIKVVHFIGRTKPWTAKTLREKIWILKTSICNPYYFIAYRQFHRLINMDKKRFSE